MAAVVSAAIGAMILTLLWWSQLLVVLLVPHDLPVPFGGYRVLMMSCYLPLLGAVSLSCHRGHRRAGRMRGKIIGTP
jgi:hypothetical protein